MIDLVAFLGFVIVLAGIADVAISRGVRANVASFILDRSSKREFSMPLNRLADKWLGQRLVSFRAFRRSAYFSIISLLVFAVAAGFPNIQVIGSVISSIKLNSSNGMIILFLSFLGCVFADFLSIIQTRIFARAIERFKDPAISTILCIADVAMSLSFFVIVFSAFRVICYIVVANIMFNGNLDYKVKIYPSPISATIDQFPSLRSKLNSYQPNTSTKGYALLLRAAYVAGKLPANANTSEVASRMRETELQGLKLKDVGSYYKVDRECFDELNGEKYVTPQAYEAYTSSLLILYQGIREIGSKEDLSKIIDVFDKKFKSVVNMMPGACQRSGFIIQKSYDAKSLIRGVSPIDAYLGAFTLTLNDTFSAISTKLSAYYEADLSDELNAFISYSWMAKSQSLFGAAGENSAAITVASYIGNSKTRAKEYAIVPMTTYVSSSLSASLILVCSVIFQAILALIRLTQGCLKKVLDRDSFEKVAFTASAMIVSTLILSLVLLAKVAEFLWISIV